MSYYTQAIEINANTVELIARQTVFTVEILTAIDANNRKNNPHVSTYVIKSPTGEIWIEPFQSFHTFGFKSSKVDWFDIVTRY